jgi:hypothetical protein
LCIFHGFVGLSAAANFSNSATAWPRLPDRKRNAHATSQNPQSRSPAEFYFDQDGIGSKRTEAGRNGDAAGIPSSAQKDRLETW